MTATIRRERIGARIESSAPEPSRLRASLAQRLVHVVAGRVRGGELLLVDDEGARRFGRRGPDDLSAAVAVRDERFYEAVLRTGGVGLGEAYELGWYDTDDLVSLLRILVRSVGPLDRVRDRFHRITKPVAEPWRRIRRADPQRDRSNVMAHYDVGDDLFERMLDPTMTYSCAVFSDRRTDLEAAQREKLDRLCRKLRVGPDDRVLEIGTGWGSFAMHAASTYGCHVTTTTVSGAQFRKARARVEAAGLGGRVTVLDRDYRKLHGRYDKLVSIEMIEAVDWRDHDAFFEDCAELLADDGLMALQAIVIADNRFDRARTTDDFIRRRIFPGGCLPSIESIARSCRRASDLRLVDLEDLGAHYSHTLHQWRDRLVAWPPAARAGFDERFLRLFEFYLAYCEAAFSERHVSVVQAILAKDSWRPDGLSLRPC